MKASEAKSISDEVQAQSDISKALGNKKKK